jgi:hypothetical protein
MRNENITGTLWLAKPDSFIAFNNLEGSRVEFHFDGESGCPENGGEGEV